MYVYNCAKYVLYENCMNRTLESFNIPTVIHQPKALSAVTAGFPKRNT